jgi:predicted metal-dependent phosphoesterase TrpH
MQEVFELSPHYGGARPVRQVLENKGYAHDYQESLRIFGDHWQHIRPAGITIAEHIACIRAAGGVTVLAHPNGVQCGEGWLSENRIAQLVEMGLDGIEIYHRTMDDAARRYFGNFAERFNLLVSGGSDEHGWSPDLPFMGQQPVTCEMIEALRLRHLERVGEPG